MSRKRRRPHPLSLVPLGFAAAVAGATVKRLRSRGAAAPEPFSASPSAGPRPDAGAPPADTPVEEAVKTEWACECGQEFRVSGEGRHRVFWLAGAAQSDPVIGSTCPECDRELPAGAAA